MRIAYVTTFDASDVHQWSGLGKHIFKCLESQGVDLVPVGSFKEYSDPWILHKRIYYNKIVRRGVFFSNRDTTVLKALGKAVAGRLRDLEIDAVFSPGTLPLSYLDIDKPIFFWTDATFTGLADFYSDLKNASRETMESGKKAEQGALSRCRAAIYSSQWAADTALENYQVAASKVHVVPFGANIEVDRNEDDIEKLVDQKHLPCRLLFFGVDWERKGGKYAVALAEALNRRGIATELIVLGCVPPEPMPDFVKVVGFVSKSTPEGRREIDRYLQEAHFLVLPSLADCAPVVVTEVNSFGMPALTSDVAGFKTLVRQGINGYVFSLPDYVEAAAERVAGLMGNLSPFREMALTSFREYQNRLNWKTAGKQVLEILSANIGQ